MLGEFTAWLVGLIKAFFLSLWDFVIDVITTVFDSILSAFVAVASAVPVPDFMAGGLQSLWANLDAGTAYMLSASGLPQGLLIIGAGYTFRLARKVATLFQW